jgi:hypothetical protein
MSTKIIYGSPEKEVLNQMFLLARFKESFILPKNNQNFVLICILNILPRRDAQLHCLCLHIQDSAGAPICFLRFLPDTFFTLLLTLPSF